MKTEIGIKLHNRFDIEVRDVTTGKIRQKVTTYNIVLNQIYSRLCGGYAIFANIHYGTGTGTLSASRTSLFTHLGTKTVTNVTAIKAVPVSSRKCCIVLNPEDNVGAVITEVGIAFGPDSSYLSTHALLKDSEGNTVSITKTATDLITIYATIFFTFTLQTGVVLNNMPASNALINYLVDGTGSIGTGNFFLGNSDVAGGDYIAGSIGTLLGAVSPLSVTNDSANKKRIYNTTRFGTTVGNGHIMEFGLGKLFRAVLPLTGIFTGQPYTAVPVGTGNAALTDFVLPSLNIKSETLKVYLDSVETQDFTTYLCKAINYAQDNNVGYWLLACSGDGNTLLSTYHQDLSTSHICVYTRQAGAFVNIMDTAYEGILRGALSYDGSRIVATGESGNNIATYSVVNNVVTKINTLALTNILFVKLSGDGNTLIVGRTGQSRIVDVYDWNATTTSWDLNAGPDTVINGNGSWGKVSNDNLSFVVACSVSPFIAVFDLVGGAWIKRVNPDVLPAAACTFASISSDGKTVVVGNTTEVHVYDWSGSAWTKRPALPVTPTANIVGLHLTATGDALLVASSTANGTKIYNWSATNNEWYYVSTNTCPANAGIGTDDDCNILWCNDSSVIYEATARTLMIRLNTAPATGVAITADYTTKGIHKTDQYVIDMSCAIQFGEGE